LSLYIRSAIKASYAASYNEKHLNLMFVLQCVTDKGKVKSVPLLAWSGPEGSRKLRYPDYMTKAQDGGKVVSFTHRPPLPPGNVSCTHFC